MTRQRSEYSQDNNNIKKQVHFKLVKENSEYWFRLENEFKYIRYRLRKILKFMMVGSSTPAVFTWLAQLKEMNNRTRGFIMSTMTEA
jgi:hypothetical protein